MIKPGGRPRQLRPRPPPRARAACRLRPGARRRARARRWRRSRRRGCSRCAETSSSGSLPRSAPQPGRDRPRTLDATTLDATTLDATTLDAPNPGRDQHRATGGWSCPGFRFRARDCARRQAILLRWDAWLPTFCLYLGHEASTVRQVRSRASRPSPRTKRTRIVLPPVLSGHVPREARPLPPTDFGFRPPRWAQESADKDPAPARADRGRVRRSGSGSRPRTTRCSTAWFPSLPPLPTPPNPVQTGRKSLPRYKPDAHLSPGTNRTRISPPGTNRTRISPQPCANRDPASRPRPPHSWERYR
jgi:hypothetical protein